MPAQTSPYFLEGYAETVLTQLGLDNLSDTERQRYLPQLTHQLEARLGAAILPLIPDSAAPEFRALLAKDTPPAEWNAFWQNTIPDFQNIIERELKQFAEDCKQILA